MKSGKEYLRDSSRFSLYYTSTVSSRSLSHIPNLLKYAHMNAILETYLMMYLHELEKELEIAYNIL